MSEANPLVCDRTINFLLEEVLGLDEMLAQSAFSDHDRTTCELFIQSVRSLARSEFQPAYRAMDSEIPELREGRVRTHPVMKDLRRGFVERGLLAATRPSEVGGVQLPVLVASAANVYLMAANGAAYGYFGLTTGAARLIESFGSEALQRSYMDRMYAGEWLGTMALTEPQAGSSLGDVTTKATPTSEGHHRLEGSKVFISGGDQDLTENIVHLALARIDGAPAGIKGVSLFVVPKLRLEDGQLVANDVSTSGVFHKMGWRGLPSVALQFGERGDCRGYLVGEAHQGIRYMFQMMNEARLMVGLMATATASVAYQEALLYAKDRTQGRPIGERDPTRAPVPIIEHADVRRMLLRQKAIVEGSLSLTLRCAMYADLAEHADAPEQKARAQTMLELLTPVAKSFPAEWGFESNTLAVQIHGGYGYTSEYEPEAWLRDQKLNSIHEGTTGIQGLDLLGRKVVAGGGAAWAAFAEEGRSTLARARAAQLPDAWCERFESALDETAELTMKLGALGLEGDVDGMLLHSADYLTLFSILVIAWQWLEIAAAARGSAASEAAFAEGKVLAAQYWLETELPRVAQLVRLVRSGEDSYLRITPEQF